MSRDEVLAELGRMLKDHSIPVDRVVRVGMGFVSRMPEAEVALFIKNAPWKEFAFTSNLDLSDERTEARYAIFRETLVRQIMKFWNDFIDRRSKD